ncbi:MAG: DUF1295 domain-containing protein [Pseudomonadota bacterium]
MLDPYSLSLAVALAGFWLLWPISVWRKDASIVDFWWAPGFVAIAWVVWAVHGAPLTGTVALTLALVSVWGLRLGYTLGLRRIREGVEDARYTEMREARDPGFWWKSFFIVFTLQPVIQFILATLIVAAVTTSGSLGPVAMIGAAIALIGVLIEARSDWELDKFRADTPHGGLLTTGLRSYVRYPSYSGEILFWVGLALVAIQAGIWWAPANALLVTLMLLRLSGVAMLDDRLKRTRPDFDRYRETVPALWPRIGGAPRDNTSWLP